MSEYDHENLDSEEVLAHKEFPRHGQKIIIIIIIILLLLIIIVIIPLRLVVTHGIKLK
jgi:flagellar basal body-associated protein FliL